MTDAPADTRRPAALPDARADRLLQLRAAGLVLAVLAVLGVVLGPVWELWSPPGPAGAVLPQGIQADETEAFVAGDGRFTLIVLIVGVLAAVAAWYLPALRRARGPYVALALAVGGVAGAALTEYVGYLIRGQGSHFACDSATGRCIDHLPLTVHMHALLLVEAVVATLGYSLFTAFAVADDLGRPDPAQRPWPAGGTGWDSIPQPGPGPDYAGPAVLAPSVGAPSVGAPSVGAQGDAEQGRGHGDAVGAP